MNTTRKITTSALMIALSTALMLFSKLIPAPWLQGGSVTLASMVPVILIGVMFGTKWGLCASLSYALIQMMFGFYPPPTRDFLSFVLVILLDYIFAYGVLGLSGLFCSLFKSSKIGVPLSGFFVTLLRYICHIFSGILIWGVYAPSGQSVLLYSLIYNGTYMIPEIIITSLALFFIGRTQILTKKEV